MSSTRSTLMPDYRWVGWRNYTSMLAKRNWHIAYTNLFIYGTCFVVFTMALGLLLAVLIDQRIRAENIYRAIFLYPLAVSFVVTGTVWGWLLNPSIGIQEADEHWLEQLPLRVADQSGHGNLHRGDSRCLAGIRLRHGTARGAALRSMPIC